MPRGLSAALLALGLIGAGATAALAAGSGGDMPSMSAPAYDPTQDYVEGVAALNAGRFPEAERSLSKVTRAVPKDAEAWRMLGAANAGQNDFKAARRAYERAVKLEPDNLAARQGLGTALGALKDAKAAAELDWIKAKAQACAGTCADAAALDAAAKAVEGAIAGAPAAALPSALIFAGPAAGDSAYLRAVELINARRYDEALAALAAAQTAFGPHPDVLTYQGYVWRKKGDDERAEAYYRMALAVAPEHRGATEYYGELKVERGDLAGAKAMLARLDQVCAYGCAEAEELRLWVAAGRDPHS